MAKATCDYCPEPSKARGMCSLHYQRWKRQGDPAVTLKPKGRKCSVPGCGKPHRAHGFCLRHDRLMQLYGTTMEPRERRFWSHVDKRSPDECWPWTGGRQKNGYGQFGTTGPRLAHRIAYEYVIGPIPEGLVLDHLCHTRDPQCADTAQCPHRRCCNPEHLEPVTRRENIARGRGGDSWGYVHEPVPAKPAHLALAFCPCGSGKPVYKRGLCRPCYRRWLKDPAVERPSKLTAEQRFWAKVDKTATCWLWTASVNQRTGYGQFARHHGALVDAHRFSWELTNGPIPEDHDVHHTCHVRHCVNPAHLEAVTRSENLRLRKYRRAAPS